MEHEEVLDVFRGTGAMLEGHFILSSGLHSDRYLQCARLFIDAAVGERICAALAALVRVERLNRNVDMIISPAMGGVIAGYEMGRQLGLPSIFFERVDGQFLLRRGFEIPQGANCLLVEDVITTGLSSREVVDAVRALGATVTAACSIVDRSGKRAELGVPYTSLLTLDIPNYNTAELPLHLKDTPAIKPGSRGLKKG